MYEEEDVESDTDKKQVGHSSKTRSHAVFGDLIF